MKPYYEDDLVTLYHGDCREVLQWLDADVLVTDPPYGMGYQSGRSDRHDEIKGDKTPDMRDTALRMWGTRPALVFGTWKQPRPANTRTRTTSSSKWRLGTGSRWRRSARSI